MHIKQAHKSIATNLRYKFQKINYGSGSINKKMMLA